MPGSGEGVRALRRSRCRFPSQALASRFCPSPAASSRSPCIGLPPLPDRITPHSLRRTYISIALLASAGDVEWVMAQVGHADAETTMRIYSQLLKRRKRDAFGQRFDALVADAQHALGAVGDAAWATPAR